MQIHRKILQNFCLPGINTVKSQIYPIQIIPKPAIYQEKKNLFHSLNIKGFDSAMDRFHQHYSSSRFTPIHFNFQY